MKIPVYKTWVLPLLVTLAICGATQAAVKPHGLISDGAVLQQGIDVPVWGTAKDGEQVTVKFQGQAVSTIAKDGQWLVKLKPLQPGGPFTMTITGENMVAVHDLLVGEVWLCSGQSNMSYLLTTHSRTPNETTGPEILAAAQRDATAAHGALRYFAVRGKRADSPLDDVR